MTVFDADSHLGAPSLAPLLGPIETGTLVDRELEIRWTDFSFPIPTGTATVDLFYTSTNPAPNYRGQLPVNLQGDVVAAGILEKDPNNVFVWDTSTIAPGTYWIWSRVNEPIGEMNSGLTFIEFSPGVVTVAHPGDLIHPAVVITRPGKPVAIAMDDYRIEYSVFDPDGTGRLTIEAAPHESEDYELVYEAAVTSSRSSILWDTAELANGDWKLRAKIVDDRGLSFTSYSRYFVTVSHLLISDAGVDAGASSSQTDSGVSLPMSLDSGSANPSQQFKGDSCSCQNTPPSSPSSGYLCLLGLVSLLSWRYSKEA